MRTVSLLAPMLALALSACGTCTKREEPVASDDAATLVATALPSTSSSPSSSGSVALHKLPRDPSGHLIPRTSPPTDPPDAGPPKPQRDPDWDLSADDPARDYVRRYVRATLRYGDKTDCITLGTPVDKGGKKSVEVRESAGCGDPNKVRDVFIVDVAADRLSVDDPKVRDALKKWPDGSDPESPPAPVVAVDDLRTWKAPLMDVFKTLKLVPIRVQLYGRGTYPVVTIAGWHGDVSYERPVDELRSIAEQVCKGNGGAPLAIFAGLDRSNVLRMRCPGAAHWDKL
jgi:hypothetical protein